MFILNSVSMGKDFTGNIKGLLFELQFFHTRQKFVKKGAECKLYSRRKHFSTNLVVLTRNDDT